MGGQKIKAPPGVKVRPTLDMVREALFSMLMAAVPGATFVDLFAGTGVVGFEALSRGAKRVVWVEREARNVALLKENLSKLQSGLVGEARCEVVASEVTRWLAGAGRGCAADVVFADPPYSVGMTLGFGAMMQSLQVGAVLRSGGYFVAEMPRLHDPEVLPGWELLRDRKYGHTRLALYRLGGNEEFL